MCLVTVMDRREHWIPGPGVTDGCEPLHYVGAGDEAQVSALNY